MQWIEMKRSPWFSLAISALRCRGTIFSSVLVSIIFTSGSACCNCDTSCCDIERQMSFYMPQLSAFYLTRNTPRSAVRAEKNRAFATARSIDIRAEEPEIIFQDGGQTAVMRFRKAYRIAGTGRTKSGEVVQELRWQKTSAGWRIFSERDIRVIR